ncbi:MAG: hypothetical protein Q9184_007496 [Pyrenodesmia sp. 2 TL-2023]
MAYDKPDKTKTLTEAFSKSATAKHQKALNKRVRAKHLKECRRKGRGGRPPPQDKVVVQARRWLNNESRKVTRIAVVMIGRFVEEKAEARKAQGAGKELADWWKVVSSRKERDDQALKALVEESGTMNPDDWRRVRKIAVEKHGDGDEGGVPLQMEMEGLENGNGEEDDESSDMGLEPVTRAATETLDDDDDEVL